jgi:hypothetical protein
MLRLTIGRAMSRPVLGRGRTCRRAVGSWRALRAPFPSFALSEPASLNQHGWSNPRTAPPSGVAFACCRRRSSPDCAGRSRFSPPRLDSSARAESSTSSRRRQAASPGSPCCLRGGCWRCSSFCSRSSAASPTGRRVEPDIALPLGVLVVPFCRGCRIDCRSFARRPSQRADLHVLLALSLAIAVMLVAVRSGALVHQDRDGSAALLDWASPTWPLAPAFPSFPIVVWLAQRLSARTSTPTGTSV